MPIAKLSIDLEARLGKFEAEMKRVGTVTDGLSKKMTSAFKGVETALVGVAGIGSLAVLTGSINDAISSMAGLKDASERTGASIEKLSALQSLAKLNGQEFAEIEGALDRLNKALHATDDESKGAGKALAAIGLDIQALRSMDPAEAFHEIAKAQEEFADGSGKAAAMMAIFGKSGAQLIPYLKELAEQERLVGTVTAEQARLADDYEKSMKRLQVTLSSSSKVIAIELLPIVEELTKEMAEGIKIAGGFGAAIRTFGTINPFRTLSENLKAYKADLEELEKQNESKLLPNFVKENNQRKIDDLRKKIDFLKYQQREAVLAGDLSANMDANDRHLRNKPTLDALLFAPDEPKTKNTRGSEKTSDAQRLLQSLNEEIALKQLALDTTDKLTAAEREAAKIRERMANGALKLDAGERQIINTRLEKLISLDKELQAQADLQKASDDYIKAIGAHFASLDEEASRLEHQAEFLGLSEAQISVITQARLEEAIAIAKANGASKENIEFLERELAVRSRITDALIDGEKKRKEQMEKNTTEINEFSRNAARNIQGTMADFLFDPFDKGMDGMVAKFGQTLQRMIADAVAADLANKMFGGKMGETGEIGGWALEALDWIGGLFASADGNAFAGSGAVHAFAAGGAFGDGEVLTSPTVFRFADGGAFRTGVAGEAGPEGALPLKRMSNGKLGVYAEGGAAPVINITQNFGPGTPAETRRAAGAGAREALAALSGAQRYA